MRASITYLITLLAALATPVARACDVCQANQTKIVSAFTHGYGPSGPSDYIAPALMVLVMVFSIARTYKCFRPTADRPHKSIKQSILASDTQ